MEPILIGEKAAKALLSGADPQLFTPAIIIGKRRFYSRVALDRAVLERAGLTPAADIDPSEAYDSWKKNCA